LIEPEKKIVHRRLQKIAPVMTGAPCSLLGFDYTTTWRLGKITASLSGDCKSRQPKRETCPRRLV